MNENELNAVQEEAVQPQYENGAENEEINEPQESSQVKTADVEKMSDEEFDSYINSAKNGSPVREVQAKREDSEKKDTSAAEKTGAAEPAESENKPFKVFNTQSEYQSEFDRIIGERLKKNRESMETLEGLKQLSLNFYGTDNGDTAIGQLMEDLQAQNAEKRGVSVDDYKRQMEDSIDAQRYRDEQQRKASEKQQIADIQSRWQKEAEDLKEIVPDFDFAAAMRNKTFYDSIVNGKSVSNAYLAANRAAPAPAVKQPRKVIEQNGNMKNAGIGKVTMNVDTMSDDEFEKYIDRIQRR